MNDERELSTLTVDLLYRTGNIKNSIKDEMMVGWNEVIKGIIFFEEILKEINPLIIDDREVLIIKDIVSKCIVEHDYKVRRIDYYEHFGINQCCMMLDCYIVSLRFRGRLKLNNNI